MTGLVGVRVGVSAITGVALGGMGVSVAPGAGMTAVFTGVSVMGAKGVGPGGVEVERGAGAGKAQLANRMVRSKYERIFERDRENRRLGSMDFSSFRSEPELIIAQETFYG